MTIIASLGPSPGFRGDWQSNSVYGKKGESGENIYFTSRVKYSERSDAHSEILTMSREQFSVVLIDSGCRGVKIAGTLAENRGWQRTDYDTRKSPSLSMNGTRLSRCGGGGRSEDGHEQG